MPDKIGLQWIAQYTENAIGNAYGYKTHNDTLKKYTTKIADINGTSKNFFMIMAPEYYKTKYEGVNFLYTMFEGTTIPKTYLDFIDKADYLLTPTTWVKNLFDKYYDPDKTFVVPHGVEPAFRFKKRKFPYKKRFRYLWVGAHNPRKGWEEVINCWKHVFQDDPSVELYIKTTRVEGLQRKGNVFLDGRNLPQNELVKLYHQAHCFLFPSRGEGFGLTLAEAMRTGLPCIGTNYSGHTDFFDEKVGYPIGYTMGEGEMTFVGDGHNEKTEIAYPHVDTMAEEMINVRMNYKDALKKGERASRRIATQFTWEKSAECLIKIIKEYGDHSC